MQRPKSWEIKPGVNVYNLIDADQYIIHLETENVRLRKALETIKQAWDISSPENVLPAKQEGELYRNDSLAAHSIINAINALKQG